MPRLLHAIALGALIAGCAKAPAAPDCTCKQPAAPAPPTAPVAPPAAGLPDGAELLAAFRARYASCRAIEVEVKGFSQGYYYGGEKTGELRTNRSRMRLVWAKPNRLRGEVLETTASLMEGAVMVTSDMRQLRVKAKGVLSLVPITMSVGDTKLASNRDHRFKDNNPPAFMARLTAPGAVWQVLGPGPGGTIAVAVEGVRRLDAGVTREVIGLEPQTLALSFVHMYEGETRVVENSFTGFRWDPAVSGDTFQL